MLRPAPPSQDDALAPFDSLDDVQDELRRLLGATPRASVASPGKSAVTVACLPTPLGPMLAGATEDALVLLEFARRYGVETRLKWLRARAEGNLDSGKNAVLEAASRELQGYFSGELRRFTVPVALSGSDFQVRVWERLREIPYGETLSYGRMARELGRPELVRAVGRANGDNRVAIVVPCHRVIGADGNLTGYGGGLWRKRRLLELEGAALGPLFEGTVA